MREVIGSLVGGLEAGAEVALCQVVAARGSTPQGAGAALLLRPDGTRAGTLGGGCVEGEVIRVAAGGIGRGGPGSPAGAEVRRFTLDHDPDDADGLICGGRMTVLIDRPAGPEALAYFRAVRRLLDAGDGSTEAVAFELPETHVGRRLLFGPDGRVVASLPGGGEVPEAVAARFLDRAGRPRAGEAGGWAILPEAPTIRLVVVGAGHVGQAVAELADRVGFAVTVVDDRPEYLKPDRFPTARRRVVGPIGPTLGGFVWDRNTYALVVTRGHGHDQEALRHLAPTACGYVGMIGSRRKIRAIFANLRDLGVDEASLARVAAPVGLPIGSGSVAEIALSIVAELVARRNRGPEALDRLRSAGNR